MRSAPRVDDETLRIPDIGEEGEELEPLDHLCRLDLTPSDSEGEDTTEPTLEIIGCLVMRRVILASRVADPVACGVFCKELSDLEGIGRVAFHPQVQGF